MSAFQSDSDISKINQNAGKGFVSIQEETFELIKKALTFSELSEGAFDITVRPLVELWGDRQKKRTISPRKKRSLTQRNLWITENSFWKKKTIELR